MLSIVLSGIRHVVPCGAILVFDSLDFEHAKRKAQSAHKQLQTHTNTKCDRFIKCMHVLGGRLVSRQMRSVYHRMSPSMIRNDPLIRYVYTAFYSIGICVWNASKYVRYCIVAIRIFCCQYRCLTLLLSLVVAIFCRHLYICAFLCMIQYILPSNMSATNCFSTTQKSQQHLTHSTIF